MAKGKNPPKGAFEGNGLTELDKTILEALPGRVLEITERLGIRSDFQAREALIERLHKLQGKGYIYGQGSPPRWALTTRGEEAIA